jgi:hypothetical protein
MVEELGRWCREEAKAGGMRQVGEAGVALPVGLVQVVEGEDKRAEEREAGNWPIYIMFRS